MGIPKGRIVFCGDKKNWWSRSGSPDKMVASDIGGPSSEIFYEFDSVKHNEKFGKECHPNCDCGRFLEIGNSVFMQFQKNEDGTLFELPQKNVDFGGGLERITAAVNNTPDIFEIDIFRPTIEKLEKLLGKKYEENKRSMRIIADHLRASKAIISEGVYPSNKLQGYILRRLIRRAALQMRTLKPDFTEHDFEEIGGNDVISQEVGKFKRSLERGLREIEKLNKLMASVSPW